MYNKQRGNRLLDLMSQSVDEYEQSQQNNNPLDSDWNQKAQEAEDIFRQNQQQHRGSLRNAYMQGGISEQKVSQFEQLQNIQIQFDEVESEDQNTYSSKKVQVMSQTEKKKVLQLGQDNEDEDDDQSDYDYDDDNGEDQDKNQAEFSDDKLINKKVLVKAEDECVNELHKQQQDEAKENDNIQAGQLITNKQFNLQLQQKKALKQAQQDQFDQFDQIIQDLQSKKPNKESSTLPPIAVGVKQQPLQKSNESFPYEDFKDQKENYNQNQAKQQEQEKLQKPKVIPKHHDVTQSIILQQADQTQRSIILQSPKKQPIQDQKQLQKPKVGISSILSHITENIQNLDQKKDQMKKLRQGENKQEKNAMIQNKLLMKDVKFKQQKIKAANRQQFANNLATKAAKMKQGYQGQQQEKKDDKLKQDDQAQVDLEDEKEELKEKTQSNRSQNAQIQYDDDFTSWDDLPPPQKIENIEHQSDQQDRGAIRTIKYDQAFSKLMGSKKLAPHFKNIQPQDFSHKSFFSRLFMSCSTSYKINEDLRRERDSYFAAQCVDIKSQRNLVDRCLYTIYKKIMGSLPPNRYGQHWMDIGFQGNDPSTDFRGPGILGLVQALYFVQKFQKESINFLEFAEESSDQDFPFAVTLIQFTVHAVRALRQGRLTSLCNTEGSVQKIFNQFYAASIIDLFQRIRKSGSAAIMNFPPIKRECQEACLRSTKQLIKDFREMMQRREMRNKKAKLAQQ